MDNPQYPVRVQAAHTLSQVLQQKASLAALMAPALANVAENERPLLQELCFGTCRWQPQLQSILGRLLAKPLKNSDSDIHALLLIGLYQLRYTRTPDHAAIATTVDACKKLKKKWAEKLVNGVLRNYQREQQQLESQLANSPSFATGHPNWLRKAIEKFWPLQCTDIFTANNAHPPFTLRLNVAHLDRQSYLSQLQAQDISAQTTPFSPFGITLQKAVGVLLLPHFEDGLVSVQDEAAQLSAELLQLERGQRVLDACCAPGGKTGHILELEEGLGEVIALDLEQRRLVRVHENLQRLNKEATIICADAGDTDVWWDGKGFDRILLDAPCSATGVIRRHPDIKLLRVAEDIAKLAALQLSLLKALWPTLKPGGRLVYATCSVLPTENTRVIEKFMKGHEDAKHCVIDADWGIEQPFGRQLLPQLDGHDGFYYACIEKASAV